MNDNFAGEQITFDALLDSGAPSTLENEGTGAGVLGRDNLEELLFDSENSEKARSDGSQNGTRQMSKPDAKRKASKPKQKGAGNKSNNVLTEHQGNSSGFNEETRQRASDFGTISFPVDVLREPYAEMVKAIAVSLGLTVSEAAVLVLGYISIAMQQRFHVRVNSVWREPTNLYLYIADAASDNKAIAMSILGEPLYQHNAAVQSSEKTKLTALKLESKRLKARQRHLIEKAMAPTADLDQCVAELLKVEDQIRAINEREMQRLLVDGSSLSAIIKHIYGQNGCVAAVSASGGFLQELGGTGTKATQLNTLLHAYSGFPIIIDQYPHVTYSLHPRLSIIFAGPSSYFDRLNSSNPLLRNLASCFLCLMDQGHKHISRVLASDIPATVLDGYQKVMASVLSSQDSGDLVFDAEAKEALAKFEKKVESMLETVSIDMLPRVAKLLNHTIRIAGILHVMSHPDAPTQTAISKRTLQDAIEVSNFFFEHATYMNCLSVQSQLDADVHFVLKKLNESGMNEITVRALNEKTKNSLDNVSRLKRALAQLSQQGVLRVVKTSSGARPSEMVQMIRKGDTGV